MRPDPLAASAREALGWPPEVSLERQHLGINVDRLDSGYPPDFYTSDYSWLQAPNIGAPASIPPLYGTGHGLWSEWFPAPPEEMSAISVPDGGGGTQFGQFGPFDQLGTFGTDASDVWNSPAADPTDPSSWNQGAGFDWTPTDIAGIGLQFGTDPGSGGFMSDGAQAYIPYETSNVTFSPGSDAGNYDVGDFGSSYDYGSDYYAGNYDVGDFSSSYDYGYSFGGDDFGGFFPVILDLDGSGIEITPFASSNMFFDMAGDGRQHRTAWAGAGDGVLALDVGNDGQITQRNEVVFTDWDATASSDMQALANVFDTNNNDSLDAGDAQFASFKRARMERRGARYRSRSAGRAVLAPQGTEKPGAGRVSAHIAVAFGVQERCAARANMAVKGW